MQAARALLSPPACGTSVADRPVAGGSENERRSRPGGEDIFENQDGRSPGAPDTSQREAADPTPPTAEPAAPGDAHDRQLEDVLARQFYTSMTSLTQYRGKGYNGDRVLQDAVAQTPAGALWDTGHPFAALLCKPWIRAFALLVAATIAANLLIGLRLMISNGLQDGSGLRLRGLGPGNASVSSLGFLRDGCAQESRARAFATERSDGALAVSYAESVRFNGWWFAVPAAAGEAAPGRFAVEAFHGGAWHRVGSSSFAWTWSGSVLLLDGDFDVANPSQLVRTHVRGRERVVEFDMRLPWMWGYAKCGTSLALLAMAASMLVLSCTERQMQGRWYCAFFLVVASAVEMLACIVYISTGEKALAMLSGIFSANGLLYAAFLAYFEHAFRHINGLCGSLYFGGVVVHYLYVGAPELIFGPWMGLENRGVVEGLGLMAFSITASLARARRLSKAERIIAGVRQAYGECWAALLRSEEARAALEQTSELAESLAASLPIAVRQRARALQRPAAAQRAAVACGCAVDHLRRCHQLITAPL